MVEAHDRFTGRLGLVCERPLLGRYTNVVDGGGLPAPEDQDGRPDQLVMASVIDIIDGFDPKTAVGGWFGVNMFVPDASTRVALTELDIAVIEHLGPLTDVCLRPQDRLDYVTELVRVGLARRVPPAGLARLASHSEDWAAVELGKLHPWRVLSARYTDAIDFYENRVAAQLVDRLDDYLGKRISELRILAAGLADLDGYHHALSRRQSWRKLERTARLIDTAISDRRASAVVIRDSLAKLIKIRTSLQLLYGSAVLRDTNRRIRLPMRLVRTNLFVNERRYREVGKLWEKWALHESAAVELRRKADAKFLDAYNVYVAILTVRSLAVLGYALEGGATVPGPGAFVRLRRGSEILVFSIDDTGVITIATDEHPLTRVIPIGNDLSAHVAESVRMRWISQLDVIPSSSIIVYPGVRSQRAGLSADTRARLHSSIRGIVPISPVEIEGEERLARALRWPLQSDRYLSGYPLSMRTTIKLPAAGWYRIGTRGMVEVLRKPDDKETSAFLLVASGNGRRNLTRDEVFDATSSLAEIDRQMALLDTCPLCAEGKAEFIPRDRNTFLCHCTECRATWGLNPCGNC